MLKIPQFQRRDHNNIIPPHIKYIGILGIIFFAAISSYLPLSSTSQSDSNYRQKVAVAAAKKTTVKKSTSIKISKSTSSVTVLSKKPTSTPTQALTIVRKITSVPTPTPTKSQQPTPTPTKTQPVQAVQSATTAGDMRQQLLSALNSYRQKKGKAALAWDDTLAGFAKGRAEQFDRDGKMDNHAGFHDLINNDGFNRMGFRALAENSSFGDTRDAVYIIETLYGQSPGHDANQLNGEYTHVGVGASGKATDFLFGGRKM